MDLMSLKFGLTNTVGTCNGSPFQLTLNFTVNSVYQFYEHSSQETIQTMFENSQSQSLLNWLSPTAWLITQPNQVQIALQIFNDTCFGVATDEAYHVKVEYRGETIYLVFYAVQLVVLKGLLNMRVVGVEMRSFHSAVS